MVKWLKLTKTTTPTKTAMMSNQSFLAIVIVIASLVRAINGFLPMPLNGSGRGLAASSTDARKLFGGYRITPKTCRATKTLPSSDPRAKGPTICMFNHECAQRNGEVVGACMDGFLFGACCQIPNKQDIESTLINDAQNAYFQQYQQQKLQMQQAMSNPVAAQSYENYGESAQQQSAEVSSYKPQQPATDNYHSTTTQVVSSTGGASSTNSYRPETTSTTNVYMAPSTTVSSQESLKIEGLVSSQSEQEFDNSSTENMQNVITKTSLRPTTAAPVSQPPRVHVHKDSVKISSPSNPPHNDDFVMQVLSTLPPDHDSDQITFTTEVPMKIASSPVDQQSSESNSFEEPSATQIPVQLVERPTKQNEHIKQHVTSTPKPQRIHKPTPSQHDEVQQSTKLTNSHHHNHLLLDVNEFTHSDITHPGADADIVEEDLQFSTGYGNQPSIVNAPNINVAGYESSSTLKTPQPEDKYVLVQTISNDQGYNKSPITSGNPTTTSSITTHVDSIESIILQLNNTNAGPSYSLVNQPEFSTTLSSSSSYQEVSEPETDKQNGYTSTISSSTESPAPYFDEVETKRPTEYETQKYPSSVTAQVPAYLEPVTTNLNFIPENEYAADAMTENLTFGTSSYKPQASVPTASYGDDSSASIDNDHTVPDKNYNDVVGAGVHQTSEFNKMPEMGIAYPVDMSYIDEEGNIVLEEESSYQKLSSTKKPSSTTNNYSPEPESASQPSLSYKQPSKRPVASYIGVVTAPSYQQQNQPQLVSNYNQLPEEVSVTSHTTKVKEEDDPSAAYQTTQTQKFTTVSYVDTAATTAKPSTISYASSAPTPTPRPIYDDLVFSSSTVKPKPSKRPGQNKKKPGKPQGTKKPSTSYTQAPQDGYQQQSTHKQPATHAPQNKYQQQSSYKKPVTQAPQNDYQQQSTHKQPTTQAPQDSYQQQSTHKQPATHAPQNNYQQQSNYKKPVTHAPQNIYQQQNNYKKPVTQAPQNDYQEQSTQNAYQQQSNYKKPVTQAPQNDYQEQSTQNAYQQQSNYKKPATLAPQNDYQEQSTQNAYQQQSNYKKPATLAPQNDYQEQNTQNSYQQQSNYKKPATLAPQNNYQHQSTNKQPVTQTPQNAYQQQSNHKKPVTQAPQNNYQQTSTHKLSVTQAPQNDYQHQTTHKQPVTPSSTHKSSTTAAYSPQPSSYNQEPHEAYLTNTYQSTTEHQILSNYDAPKQPELGPQPSNQYTVDSINSVEEQPESSYNIINQPDLSYYQEQHISSPPAQPTNTYRPSTTRKPISTSYVTGPSTPRPPATFAYDNEVPPLIIADDKLDSFIQSTAESLASASPTPISNNYQAPVYANAVTPIQVQQPQNIYTHKKPGFVKIKPTFRPPVPTVVITPKPTSNVYVKQPNGDTYFSSTTPLPAFASTSYIYSPSVTRRPDYDTNSPEYVSLPPITSNDFDDPGYYGSQSSSAVQSATPATYPIPSDDRPAFPGYFGPTPTYPAFQIPDEKNDGSIEETYTSPNDFANFPPVRHPNLNMSAASSAVTSDLELSTPAFVEDGVLKDKMNTLVHKIVESLQGNFEALAEIIDESETPSTYQAGSPGAAGGGGTYPTTVTRKTTKKPQATTKPKATTKKPVTRITTKAPTKKPTVTTRKPATRRPTTRKPITTRRPTKKPTPTTTNAAPFQDEIIDEEDEEDISPNVNEIGDSNTGAGAGAGAGGRKIQCGVRPHVKSGRIVGGKGSAFGAYPWQVLVRESTWLGLFTKNKCGGVLITNKYVVTAAHCQPGFLASLVAVMGEFDISGDLESKKAVTKNVKRVIVHRQYDAATFENDLALLELESPVQFDTHIVPICMPTDLADFTGRMATVTGWGRLKYGGGVPSVLQEVQVPIIENSVCQEMFHTAGHNKKIINSFLCAGYANGQKDSCEGDSGGPLVLQRPDGRYELAGTVSHGIKCAAPYLPGVYMRTTYYKPWLRAITGVK